MVRRFLPFVLLALLVPLIVACGQTGTSGQSPNPTTASGGAAPEPTEAPEQPTEAAAQPTEAPEQGGEAQIPDLGGRTVVVGSDTTYPPMEFINEETREVEGFSVDMMKAMGELLNAKFEFTTFPNFDAIFAALSQGQFDIVVSSVSVTEKRKQVVNFSDPYLSIGQAIAIQEDNTSIMTVEDLQQAELIGVQGGTTGEQAVKEAGIPNDRIRRYDTIDVAFQELSIGAVDAVVADGPPIAQYTAQIDNIKPAGEPFTTENYAIALQKGDTELQQAINAGLAEMKRNGTLEQLMEKWNLKGVATLP